MNVLIQYPKFYVFGGAEIVIVRLCNYLSGLGGRPAVMTTRSMPEIEEQLSGTRVIVVPNKRERTARYHADVIRGELEAMSGGIKRYGREFDVLNPHNFPTEIAAMRSKLPSVWMCNEPELHITIHNPRLKLAPRDERWYFQFLYRYERAFLKHRIGRSVVSDRFNAERFKKIFRIDPSIVHYGIEYEFFSQEEQLTDADRRKYDGRFVILHVGMITPLKNQMATLKALAAIKQRVPSAHLILAGSVGDETYRNEMQKCIVEHGLEGSVEFAGHVDRNELRHLFALSHVMMHPVNSQGGWLSPFEMLSAGKPVIVSNELTASYIIKRENIGIVSDEYAESLVRLHQNYGEYLDMARRGREFVRDNLTWNNYCSSMVSQFESVLSKRSG